MNAAFFPGFEPAVLPAPPETVITIRPVARPTSQPAHSTAAPSRAAPAHVEAFTQRVQWFTRSLPPIRRAEIGLRARFRKLPWLRRSSQ